MENIIRDYIVKNAKLHIERDNIKDDTNLMFDLGYDSLQMIQLILDIENHFKFMFEEEDLFMEQLATFGSFKNLIAKKCEEQ